MERTENLVSVGTPDVDGVLNGVHFKVELKTVARPVRDTTSLYIKFQPAQPDWIESFCRAGGRCFVLVQVGMQSKARRYLVHGRDVKSLSAPLLESSLALLSLTDGKQSATETLRMIVSSK